MKTKLLISALILSVAPFASTYADDGAQLFKTNCGACHSVGKGKLVGPDLKGVENRHTEAWILKWVKSSQSLVKAGDKDADELFQNNNQIVMPDQSVNDDEIKSILGYIKTGGEQAAAENTKTATVQGQDNVAIASQKAAQEKKEDSGSIFTSFSFTEYMLMFLMGILLIVVYVLGMAVKTLTERLHESDAKVSHA